MGVEVSMLGWELVGEVCILKAGSAICHLQASFPSPGSPLPSAYQLLHSTAERPPLGPPSYALPPLPAAKPPEGTVMKAGSGGARGQVQGRGEGTPKEAPN